MPESSYLVMKHLFFALRPKLWIKNCLIFTPLIFGKKLFLFPTNLKLVIGFFLFSLTASVAYLINDIIDIEKDKRHPIKRSRPIPSGKVSIRQARIMAFFLATVSVTLSFMLSAYFGWISIIYLIFNYFYTKIFKKIVIIDVFCLAVFFLVRIVVGGILAKTKLSHWVIFMTTLLALFLGFNKRRQELSMNVGRKDIHSPELIQYSIYFIDKIVVITTSLIAIAYVLYTVDARTVADSGSKYLVFTMPFVYYGIFRYLFLIRKNNSYGDPTFILFSDIKMQINILAWLITCIALIYLQI